VSAVSAPHGNRGSAAVLLVLAGIVLVGGILIGTGPPRCGGRIMSPGDSCYSYRHGTQSYEEAARTAGWAPAAGAVLALALAAGAAYQVHRGNDRGRPPGATAPPPRRTPAPGTPGSAGTSATSLDAMPLARTPAEAQLAMNLSPCSCGASDVLTEHALFEIDGTYVGRYSGTCRCGKPREFMFRLPDEPLVSPPGGFRFGDGGPSQLLDPGVWLAVADHYAGLAPADVTGLDDAARRTARQNMLRAVAAMDEVIAFVPPGVAVVPPSAFTSPTGRQVRDREPGRFRRIRLEAVRDTYREIVAEMTEPPAGAPR
jgi:hypothetical protein